MFLRPKAAKPNVARMNHSLSRLVTRLAYASRQLPRMAWYAGHLSIMRRLARLAEQQDGGSPRARRSNLRIEQRLNADRASLLEKDLANVRVGVYPMSADHDGSLFTILNRSRLFFRDLPDVDARRRAAAQERLDCLHPRVR